MFAELKPAFKFMGVDIKITRRSWLALVVWPVLGLIVSLLFLHYLPLVARMVWGIAYGYVALLSFVVLHLVGHIISGNSVESPMDAGVIDGLRVYNVYAGDQSAVAGHVHFGRAIGGPLMNLTLSLIGLILWIFFGGHLFLWLTVFNLLAGGLVLLPIPGFDGAVIWREMRGGRTSA